MSGPSKPGEILAVKVRADMINGQFVINEETTKFMTQVRKVLGQAGMDLAAAAPDHVDVGRLIAALDSLQHTKNLFCDAVLIGNEAENRKKRKTSDE